MEKNRLTVALEDLLDNSCKVISKTIDFFYSIYLIELNSKSNFQSIWLNVFYSTTISFYTKLFKRCINNFISIKGLVNIFLLNFNSFKEQLFDDDCFNQIEKMQTFFINIFPNVIAGCKEDLLSIIQFLFNFTEINLVSESLIENCSDSFGMESEIFPNFIIDLINNTERFGGKKLFDILII